MCTFMYTVRSSHQKFLGFSLTGTDLSVPGFAVGSVLSSMGLYQSVGFYLSVSQEAGHPDLRLPG